MSNQEVLFIAGKMRLHLLGSHCPAFMGGLFNLLGHMQGPSLFCERHQNSKFNGDRLHMVSAVPVVLCSVEVLTTLAARAVIFPMKANFVALALQSPALLFRPFHEFGKPNSVVLLQSSVLRNEIQQRGKFVQTFDEKSVKLYIACCRLLCALLRHRLRYVLILYKIFSIIFNICIPGCGVYLIIAFLSISKNVLCLF